jgi:dihydroorotate dehydrogenase
VRGSGYEIVRRILFRMDPERVHELTLRLLALAGASVPGRAILRQMSGPVAGISGVEALGLRFPNPIGLAAGYDKDGQGLRGLSCLGFGHIELGTVTLQPQDGNPRPRIFRLPEDEALINRMGFPNAGAACLARRLRRGRPSGVIVGVNLGKGRDTPLERAAEDYVALLRLFVPLADYLAINISSPNTAGLRQLQARQALEGLMRELNVARDGLQEAARRVPLVVKLSPDLDAAELDQAVGVLLDSGVEGVIATNTTVARPALRSIARSEQGGLSGRPLGERSLEVLRHIARLAGGRLAVIAAGGVFTAQDVRRRQDAGADLIQVYTGLVYRGPRLVGSLLRNGG